MVIQLIEIGSLLPVASNGQDGDYGPSTEVVATSDARFFLWMSCRPDALVNGHTELLELQIT